jgi:hypothetical protein
MGTVNFAGIEAALATLFYDDITNTINRAVVLAQVLDVKPGTGKNIQWTIRHGTATPATAKIADGADVTVFNNDTKIPAVLQFGTFHDAFAVTGKAMAAAMAAGNPQELASLMVDELGDSIERLSRAIAEGVYTGDGTTDDFHGLHDATNPAIGDSGTYAGIARGSVAQWKGNVVPAGGGPLTFALIRRLRRNIYDASGERPDLFICDSRQHEVLGLLFDKERRYVDQVRRNDGSVIKLSGGYNVLEFDGISVIEDTQHPALKFSALNTRHVYLTQLPDASSAATRSMGTVGLMGTPEEQFGEGKIPLTARLQPLAVDGDAFKFQLINYPQVVVRRPNATGFIDDLAA